MPRHRFAFVALACAAACGGRIAAIDGGSSVAPDDGGPSDATDATTADAGAPEAAPPPCNADAAFDAALCTPPADDTLVADPPVITAAAGGYGTATFVAKGPWASAPELFLHYTETTLPVQTVTQVQSYGSPQSIVFLLQPGTVGVEGTLTVEARVGNIERFAQVTVKVTDCLPWPASTVCSTSRNCGFEGDGCGGLLSCGTCAGATPYCFLGVCQATMPTYCPSSEGLGPNGCEPCAQTRTCRTCTTGRCLGIEDVCTCLPYVP